MDIEIGPEHMKQRTRSPKNKVQPAETLHLILRLSNKLMAPFSAYLENQYDISVNEFRVLMFIGRKGETASHEVAHETGVNIMSVSRAVSTLERDKRITVIRDPANRRRKMLRLTEEGKRLFIIMSPQANRVADYLLSNLEEKEILLLDQFLEAMVNTLEAVDETGRSVFLERTRPS
ncbi:MAG: winged helix-turn-helix transcriptional regulator [Hyphomonas sp.]|nr:winged helix-turn-helix transcriptional regulator [Hyphomonas sp.]